MRQPHGQNFLTDNNIAGKIVQSAGIQKGDIVIEVGPGRGALTNILKYLTDTLIAVDIDKNLAALLKFQNKDNKNVTVINEDFLKHSLPSKPFKIVANLPYNVGTAIVQKFLPDKNFVSAVVMLQKDVVARLVGKEGTKEYGYISLFRQYYADAEVLFDVSPGCFNPKPKVTSAVIKLTSKRADTPNGKLFPLIKHCFSMRRKTMLNCLSSFLKKDKTQTSEILGKSEIGSALRPDKVTLRQYRSLADLIVLE